MQREFVHIKCFSCGCNAHTLGDQIQGLYRGHGKPGKSWNLKISFSRPGKSWNLIVDP